MTHLVINGDARRLPFPDRSVDLVFGSPPYCDARSYGIGAQRDCQAWVDWMLGITAEALRVARNCVVWIAAGVTRDRNYWPACEGLMWEWWKLGLEAYRPCYWHRSGIPGSGGDQWFRSDVEYAMCFKRPGELAWADNKAAGKPPKYPRGGCVSYRQVNGDRIPDGRTAMPDIANPGNLIQTGPAGGNHLGSPIAHENEAPFPEALAEFFVRSLCPPGGIVLDPFFGSGTTAAVASRHGRHGIGLDIRDSQCRLAVRRIERPHSRPHRTPRKAESMPLFAPESLNSQEY